MVGTKCTSEPIPNRALRAQNESQTTAEIFKCLEGKAREGIAYPESHTGNLRREKPGPHLRTCKPVSKGSRERAIKLVGGRNEIHVGANPKKGTKSANGIPNHYENLIMSRRENSGGHSLPPDAHAQRTKTKARTPFKEMQASLERKPREGHQTRRW